MKKILLISFATLLPFYIYTQNVGVGTSDPTNRLHVIGNLLINEPYTSTNTPPTPAQTKTMINNTTVTFSNYDSTGRIFDPGGPTGDYLANLTAYADIANFNQANIGIELTLENVSLGTGDSLIVRATASPTSPVFLRIGNGYTTPGQWILNTNSCYVIFKSNSDANVGSGFSLLFRRLHSAPDNLLPLAGSAGKAFFFDTHSGAIRSGNINSSARGANSVGLGGNSTASGIASIALGSCTASGDYSVSIGSSGTASGFRAVSIGTGNYASGEQATAGGSFTQASGSNALSFGHSTVASGDYASSFSYLTDATGFASVAMGSYTEASESNSFAMGDHTTASGFASTALGSETEASGTYSIASGLLTVAEGSASTAFGGGAEATGHYSTAFGYFTLASGLYATAQGYFTDATGESSSAFGRNTLASGINSTAAGFLTIANGNNSTAMGTYVSTSGFNGAFVIGDNSTTTIMQSFVANGFRSRFAGGYRLLSNSAANLGVVLLPDGTSWGVISDVRLKENFLVVDGEEILQKIAVMPLTTWNYIAQSDKTSRHYGPMAQDFFAAFGKDDLGIIGCDTLINQQDFLGVSLVAIQALEKRTADLQEQMTEMRLLLQACLEQNAILEERNKALTARLQIK